MWKTQWTISSAIVFLLSEKVEFLVASANKPCMGYGTSAQKKIPNLFIKDLIVSPLLDDNNFIRLNFTVSSYQEYENITGSIRIFSKYTETSKCHRYKQHYFSLKEKQFIIPRFDYPAVEDEIRKLCEYVIDMEIKGVCISINDSFLIPENFGEETVSNKCNVDFKILSITFLGNDSIKVEWTLRKNDILDEDINVSFYLKSSADEFVDLANVTCTDGDFAEEFHLEFPLEAKRDLELIGKIDVNPNCHIVSSSRFTVDGLQVVSISFVTLKEIIIAVLTTVVIIAILSTIILFKLKSTSEKKSKYIRPNAVLDLSEIPLNGSRPTYIDLCQDDVDCFKELEVSRNNIQMQTFLGRGAFGDVYSAKVSHLKELDGSSELVAVKILRDENSNKGDILEEIRTMHKIGCHKNIVQLLGCCTTDKPCMFIMELLEKQDLSQYLKSLRQQLEVHKAQFLPKYGNLDVNVESEVKQNDKNAIAVYDNRELQTFALQIAEGMMHLEKLNIIHRDLAARNILMTKNRTLKISDFGMSKMEPYFLYLPYKQPARWMAIESLRYKFFNTKSDVWSFGVVLWEIGTLGALPYEDIDDIQLSFHLNLGTRLGKPPICTTEIYSMMERCWQENPKLRPSFKELVRDLNVNPNKIYIVTNVEEIIPPSVIFNMKQQRLL